MSCGISDGGQDLPFEPLGPHAVEVVAGVDAVAQGLRAGQCVRAAAADDRDRGVVYGRNARRVGPFARQRAVDLGVGDLRAFGEARAHHVAPADADRDEIAHRFGRDTGLADGIDELLRAHVGLAGESGNAVLDLVGRGDDAEALGGLPLQPFVDECFGDP